MSYQIGSPVRLTQSYAVRITEGAGEDERVLAWLYGDTAKQASDRARLFVEILNGAATAATP